MVLLKKAQIETFGLVIIVILLSFILIFALQFLIKPKQTFLEEDYLQLQANNLRSVILKTNLCQAATIKEEIINCEFDRAVCLGGCEDLKPTIRIIIENSIQENIKYEFMVEVIDTEPLFTIDSIGFEEECNNPITAVSEPFAGTDIKASLKLCLN